MRKPVREPTALEVSSRVDLVLSVLMALIGVALLGVGIGGFWVSADLGRSVVASFDGVSQDRGFVLDLDDQYSELASVLTWLVLFAPCLVGGAILLWKTFTGEDDSWLAPLQRFNIIVAYKIMHETRRKESREHPCIDIMPMSSEQKRLHPSEDEGHSEKTS